eukprot:TRINITY_DN92275_c0_g1_i1.p1 TRINITY_DN92275_c0_g1~~TRINITY_DN92275_c0_g1_i1.p1  ORF type:complete len:358 (+),score=62.23 TRINITY_DN92275_c0_g1_i1:134-1075(+)
MVAWPVGDGRFGIITPDDDEYVEDWRYHGGDVDEVIFLAGSRDLPAGLGHSVYRFGRRPTNGEMKQIFQNWCSTVKDLTGREPVEPRTCVNEGGSWMPFSQLFGGFVSDRLRGKRPAASSAPPLPPPLQPPKEAGAEVPVRDIPFPIVADVPQVFADAMVPFSAPPAGYGLMVCGTLGSIQVGSEVKLDMPMMGLGVETVLVRVVDQFLECDIVPFNEWEASRAMKVPAVITPRPKGQLAEDNGSVSAAALRKKAYDDDVEKVRTLWADVDEQGEQYKDWQQFCKEIYVRSWAPAGSSVAVQLLRHSVVHACR